jgi:hypothetical protein
MNRIETVAEADWDTEWSEEEQVALERDRVGV